MTRPKSPNKGGRPVKQQSVRIIPTRRDELDVVALAKALLTLARYEASRRTAGHKRKTSREPDDGRA